MKDHIDTVIDAVLQERKAITRAVKWFSFFTLLTLCGTVLLLTVLVPENDRKDAAVEIARIFGAGDHFWCVFVIMFLLILLAATSTACGFLIWMRKIERQHFNELRAEK